MRKRWSLVGASIIVFSLLPPHAGAATGAGSSVFAGSGAIGIADGPAASASFMLPAQLAFDPANGVLYVADEAAQRIRAIDRAGAVRTIAGSGAVNASGVWVPGGYADGPAPSARFDRPEGIAVTKDGVLYVADAANHCIRRIANGTVSTFAGNAGAPGTADGPRASARFESPRQLSLDTDGTLYVADWGAGVRKISPDGTVSTLHFGAVSIDRASGISVGHTGPFSALFVADAQGLVRANLDGSKAERVTSFPNVADETPTNYVVSSDVPLGVPHGIAAMGVGDLAYTDLRDSTVKYLRVASYVRYLGSTPVENAMVLGGSGSGGDGLQFDSPMGVAAAPDGTLYISDSGHRRIVRVAPFARRAVSPDVVQELAFPPQSYRVAVIGSSFTWWASLLDDSIAGFLQDRLAQVPALAHRRPVARSVQLTLLSGEFDFIDTTLSLGAVDLVVFLVAPSDADGLNLGHDPAGWAPVVTPRFAKSAAALKAAGIPFLLVLSPSAPEFDPAAAAYLYESVQAEPVTDYDVEHRAMLAAMNQGGAPVLDLYPAFLQEIGQPEHQRLFDTTDDHYTRYGREFVAQAIFDRLQALQPWSRR